MNTSYEILKLRATSLGFVLRRNKQLKPSFMSSDRDINKDIVVYTYSIFDADLRPLQSKKSIHSTIQFLDAEFIKHKDEPLNASQIAATYYELWQGRAETQSLGKCERAKA